MDRRPDWVCNHNKIKEHVRNLPKVIVSGSIERALASIPKMAEELGLDKGTVRTHLEEITGKEIDGRPVIAKVGGVELVILDPKILGFPRLKYGVLFPRIRRGEALPRLNPVLSVMRLDLSLE